MSLEHHKITLAQPVDDGSSDSGLDLSKLRRNGIPGLFSVDRLLRPQSPGTLSNLSVDDRGQLILQSLQSSTPQPRVLPPSWRSYASAFWVKNKGLAFVVAAQVFNCLMNVTIRILEIEGNHGKGFHPLQVLFVRMSITALLASSYMMVKKTRDFPLGAKGVRLLLLVRGFGGFVGVFGVYFSLLYLPLADATVITFLSPVIACAVCAALLKEEFSRMEQLAAFISLLGVVLIARPTAIFSYFQQAAAATDTTQQPASSANNITDDATASLYLEATSQQKVLAVAVAMVGVLGGATVITTLRWISNRAHPLITVNYFATLVVIVSGILSALIPGIGFALPGNLKEWALLLFLGLCGFTSQYLSAAGLMYERSSRATNMIYSQMLFALIMDKLVFGHSPELLSLIGSSLILGSAIVVAIRKAGPKLAGIPGEALDIIDEEIGLMSGVDASEEVSETISMREMSPRAEDDRR